VCAAAVLDGLAAAAQINATMVLELLTFRSSGLMCGTDPSLSRKRARNHGLIRPNIIYRRYISIERRRRRRKLDGE
jgi:hypothetical protein